MPPSHRFIRRMSRKLRARAERSAFGSSMSSRRSLRDGMGKPFISFIRKGRAGMTESTFRAEWKPERVGLRSPAELIVRWDVTAAACSRFGTLPGQESDAGWRRKAGIFFKLRSPPLKASARTVDGVIVLSYGR